MTVNSIRRTHTFFVKEFKLKAVQMVLDGYSADLVSEILGTGHTTPVYRLKSQQASSSLAKKQAKLMPNSISTLRGLRSNINIKEV